MPPAGAEGRARQLGTLAALRHRELVRPDAGAAIDALQDDGDALDDDARAMLRLAARERERALRVPEALVREITEACSRCVSAWIEARAADDFAAYAGPLRRVMELKRREAEAIGDRRRALRRPPRRVRAGRPRGRPRAGLRRPARAAGADPGGGLVARAGRAAAPRLARGRPDGARARHRRPGRLRGVGRRDRPLGAPVHRLAARRRRALHHPARAREPPQQHRRGHARARPRALRAGPARGGRPHPAARRPLAGRPRVAVALLGEPDRPHPGVLGRAGAGPARALPGGDGRPRPEPPAPRRAGRAPVADPRRGRRGDLQPPHRAALRDRARADPRRPGRRRPAGRLRGRHGADARHPPARATPSASCRTSTGPRA